MKILFNNLNSLYSFQSRKKDIISFIGEPCVISLLLLFVIYPSISKLWTIQPLENMPRTSFSCPRKRYRCRHGCAQAPGCQSGLKFPDNRNVFEIIFAKYTRRAGWPVWYKTLHKRRLREWFFKHALIHYRDIDKKSRHYLTEFKVPKVV